MRVNNQQFCTLVRKGDAKISFILQMLKRLFPLGLRCVLFFILVLSVSFGFDWPHANAKTQANKDSTVAKSARVGGDKLRTRFVADLSKKVPFKVLMLSDPYRVIIDMPNVRFQMPADLGSKGRGLIKAYRFGLFAPGKSRIVIDISSPFLVDKSFILKAQNGQPARFVIDLVPTDQKTFLAAVKKSRMASRKEQTLTKAPRSNRTVTNTRRKKNWQTERPL